MAFLPRLSAPRRVARRTRRLALAALLSLPGPAVAQTATVERTASYLADTAAFRPGEAHQAGSAFYGYVRENTDALDRALGSWEALGVWATPYGRSQSGGTASWLPFFVFVGDVRRADGGDVGEGVLFVAYTSNLAGEPTWRGQRFERIYAGCRSGSLRLQSVRVSKSAAPDGAPSAQYSADPGTMAAVTPLPGSIADSVVRYLCTAPLPPWRRDAATNRTRAIIGKNLAWLVAAPWGVSEDSLYRVSGEKRGFYADRAANLAKLEGPGWVPVGWWGFPPFRERPYHNEYGVVVAWGDTASSPAAARKAMVRAYRFMPFSYDTAAGYTQFPARFNSAWFSLQLTCAPKGLRILDLVFENLADDGGRFRHQTGGGQGPLMSDFLRLAPDDALRMPVIPGSPGEAIVNALCDGARPR